MPKKLHIKIKHSGDRESAKMRCRVSEKSASGLRLPQRASEKSGKSARSLRARGGKVRRLAKLGYFAIAAGTLAAGFPHAVVRAAMCPDVKMIFARGSGGERWVDKNYQAFKASLEKHLGSSGLKIEYEDLDYPAVAVGADNAETLKNTLGALVHGGEGGGFGESVADGSQKLIAEINSGSCPNTKYVLGGYSQGAIVVSKSLPSLSAEKLIYASTFGDPKIYLPEGAGPAPAACVGKDLSDYRRYVPNCEVYQGLLGGYIPYEPAALTNKVGVWCNKDDIFCTPFLNLESHISYVADDLYEDAAKVITQKVHEAFGIADRVYNFHDTAILIDSTGSMAPMIDQYKAEARRLAEETLNAGGRVALYDYRDVREQAEPTERCNFSTCTLEVFEQKLGEIEANNGGDADESLLSSSWHVMNKLEWRKGATKSLVVLTDAGFHNPDLDERHTTLADVVELSKTIDPVNFYIITKPGQAASYQELAAQTDGKVVTNMNELSLLTDQILDRFDSLPRVEEGVASALPTLNIDAVECVGEDTSKVKFSSDTDKTIVILNDEILGMTAEHELMVTGLDMAKDNTLTLVPVAGEFNGAGTHGMPVSAALSVSAVTPPNADAGSAASGANTTAKTSAAETVKPTQAVPKTPNTGIVREKISVR